MDWDGNIGGCMVLEDSILCSQLDEEIVRFVVHRVRSLVCNIVVNEEGLYMIQVTSNCLRII